jgi:hypothetical protein
MRAFAGELISHPLASIYKSLTRTHEEISMSRRYMMLMQGT